MYFVTSLPSLTEICCKRVPGSSTGSSTTRGAKNIALKVSLAALPPTMVVVAVAEVVAMEVEAVAIAMEVEAAVIAMEVVAAAAATTIVAAIVAAIVGVIATTIDVIATRHLGAVAHRFLQSGILALDEEPIIYRHFWSLLIISIYF